MALCVLALLASGRGSPPAESPAEKAGAELASYFFAHPYLKVDEATTRKLFPGVSEDKRAALLEALKAAARPPADPAEIRSEQAELDRLIAALQDAAEEEHPIDRWALVPARPTLVTFLTHMFLHAGWLHLLGNLFILYLTGPYLEDVWGRPLYAALYAASGVVAAGVFVLRHSSSEVPLVGASGAIAGLMGAFLVRYARTRIRFAYMITLSMRGTFDAPAWVMLPLWFLQQIFFAALTDSDSGGGVAYLAHVAGFAFGAAAAAIIAWGELEARWLRPRIEAKVTTTHVDRPEIDRAMAARAAGDHDGALAILKAEAARSPNDRDAALALWDAALACGRAEEAAPAMLRAVRQELRGSEGELAAEHWLELVRHVPGAALEATTAVRLAQALEASGHREEALRLLRNVLDSAGSQIEPGLALRVARVAGACDRELGLRAARLALEHAGLAHAERDEAERIRRECGGVPLASVPPSASRPR